MSWNTHFNILKNVYASLQEKYHIHASNIYMTEKYIQTFDFDDKSWQNQPFIEMKKN